MLYVTELSLAVTDTPKPYLGIEWLQSTLFTNLPINGTAEKV